MQKRVQSNNHNGNNNNNWFIYLILLPLALNVTMHIYIHFIIIGDKTKLTVEQMSNIHTLEREHKPCCADVNTWKWYARQVERSKNEKEKKYAEIDCNHNDIQPFNVWVNVNSTTHMQ